MHWLHKARELPKEEFRREVEKELTGKDTEPSEIIYFKLYKSQIPVVERATEIAGLMLGTDNRGAIVWRWSAPIFWRELVSTEPIPTCYFIHSFDSSNSSTKSGKRRLSPK